MTEPQVESIYKGGGSQTESRTAKDLIQTEWQIIDKLLHMAENTHSENKRAFYYQTLAGHIRTLSMLLKLHGQPNQTVTATLHQQHVSENPRIAITQLKPCLKDIGYFSALV
jgi:hypothetical protein